MTKIIKGIRNHNVEGGELNLIKLYDGCEKYLQYKL